ncbi:MAG: hypothetical protein KA533_01200 [Sphingobium sp.]|nr:hypothetical protein [Sphingobium sp.]MBP6111364.1 hypothetical protein [Sphingobium sp.]MBP8670891.1 hypothetical protein [Sphingobium sp.]MBP9156682.1 hypothetical protein [Sphingobium sp.]MCC6481528.1 hypothetical protein [Sphingomonadaceae bacterium]
MDFQDLLMRYFGQAEIETLPAAALDAGMERMRVDFGLEQHAGQRFGLWALLYMLGNAPDLDSAFADAADRDAARNFMDMADKMG